jgi:Membrane domain of glycerophosphoryl diester phosphodiesterase
MSKLSIGKAWEEASAFLVREIRLVTPVALALFAVPAALMGWINPGGQPATAPGGLGWPLTLIALIVTMIGQMSIAALAIGWSGSIGGVMALAARRVWGLLGTVLLVFVPLTILTIIAVAVLIGSAGITDPGEMTPQALAATPGIGIILIVLVLLFLFIGVRLFPISAIAITETANPLKLLSRSWRLTRGHFLRLLAVLLLVVIAAMAASIAVTTVVGSLMALVAGEPKPFSLSALITALADGIIASAISAISAAMVGRIYVQLSAGQASVPEVSAEG